MTRYRTNQLRRDLRARRRRLLKLALAGVLPPLVLGGLIAFSAGLSWSYRHLLQADGFRLTQVQISGIERMTPEQVLDALAVPKGANMLALKLHHLHRRIAELPWVAQARVRLGLPAKLSVTIQERQPLVLLEADPPCLVDQSGTLFLPASSDQYPDLPRLAGFAEAAPGLHQRLPQPVLQPLRELAAALSAHPLRPLGPGQPILEWKGSHGLVGKVSGTQLEIVFGTENFSLRCDRLRRILERLHQNQRLEAVARIDLDYRQRAFVTWREASRSGA